LVTAAVVVVPPPVLAGALAEALGDALALATGWLLAVLPEVEPFVAVLPADELVLDVAEAEGVATAEGVADWLADVVAAGFEPLAVPVVAGAAAKVLPTCALAPWA
jgi:hypothetical protein